MPFIPHTDEEVREMLERFIDAMLATKKEAETDPDLLRSAPHTLSAKQLEAMRAASNLDLAWKPANG